MQLFPIFAHLENRRVLVVGGGEVALRKVQALLKCKALVTVGSPALDPELQQLLSNHSIAWLEGTFQTQWLDETWLVVAATDDRAVNQSVAAAAEERRIFVNVVDDPSLCSFQVPSIVDRSPLIIAISSSGYAPVIARRVRERIESLFDHSLGPLVSLAQRYRQSIRQQLPELRQRRQFYDWLLDGPVASLLRRQQPEAAAQQLEDSLQHLEPAPAGKVILVGAGPGDPGLLTLKALRALNEADVILHDRLVSDAILDLARRDAQAIYVGKTPGEDHEATQQRIHALMRDHALQGKCVVRLKGGDAFVFGRGGEELQSLAAHGIAFEVVPGITAALACAAYAGIPLTHRDHAQAVTLITAYDRQDDSCHDWNALANTHQTLAFYMGIAQLPWLSNKLMSHGRDGATPCALVERGSRPEQRVLHTTLEQLAQSADEGAYQAPALLLVGDVTLLGKTLHWFGEQTSTT